MSNKSEFDVNMDITRALCDDLSPFLQAKIIQRTANGLPIYAFRPETCRIEPGAAREVEFTFRPDRGRDVPFREDINISVGQSDGLIKVCIVGRAVGRQVFVSPADPLDEPFYKKMNASNEVTGKVGAAEGGEITDQTTISAVSNLLVEDMIGASASAEVREIARESRQLSGMAANLRQVSKIKLEYPDPFAEGVDEESYVEVEPGGKAPAKGAPPAAQVVTRRQSRKLNVSCAKIFDGRPNSTAGGSYEVVLSQEAISSGLFQVIAEKGNVAVGVDVMVEIQCSLPSPKGIGGLQVGSWQTYDASVVLRGGWKLDGTSDEVNVPILLSAYVRL